MKKYRVKFSQDRPDYVIKAENFKSTVNGYIFYIKGDDPTFSSSISVGAVQHSVTGDVTEITCVDLK